MIEYTVNMNAVDFPGSGQYRMVSKWYEMTGSQDFELKDKSGNVKKDLSKVRGAVRTYNSLFSASHTFLLQMSGACIRYNVIPTSVKEASLQIQIFPRDLLTLTRLCHENNVSLSSPAIPAMMFKPQDRQAVQLHFAAPDVECNINIWPFILWNGVGDLENFPSVHELDVNISGNKQLMQGMSANH